jgi:small ligand-binding sensory domain FIST
MIQASTGISGAADAQRAGHEAARAARSGLSEVDGALLFAGPGYGDDLGLLLDAAVSVLGTERVAGASAHGVLAGGQEHEDETAVAVLAWSGLEAVPFLVSDPSGDEAAACEEIALRLDGTPRPEDLVVVLPDPRNLDPEIFLPELAAALAPAQIVGAGAGDPLSDEPLQWLGRSIASGGVSGMVLRPRKRPRVAVTQACRPVTKLLTVTRARGHWVLELDGRPALEVFREVARGPLGEDLERAAAFVLAALPSDPKATALEPDAYLVRHLVGFAPEENAFALPVAAENGARLALAVREPESAREDLKAMLERVGGGDPALGLYFNCCARGAGFFGVPGLEAAYLESVFRKTPIAGLFGSCEIGPVGGRPELLTYTGVLALIDD